MSSIQSDEKSSENESKVEPELKILCFGDSLTEGYTNGYDFSPYSTTLEKLISKDKNIHGISKCTIYTAGVSGERAADMYPRLVKVLNEYSLKKDTPEKNKEKKENKENKENTENKESSSNHMFDFVIILGGTNDIGSNSRITSKDVINTLIKLHEYCLRTGDENCRTIAVTIPECGAKIGWLDKTRNEVNQGLKDFVEKSKENVLLCDFFNQMPYHSMDKKNRNVLWSNDGLHFTPKGYEKMASIIYGVLKPAMKK